MLKELLSIEASNSYGSFLMKHGRHWLGAPLPKGTRQGMMKNCYRNSQNLVLSSRNQDEHLIYVEGYATARTVPIAVLHAWVVDGEGRVIDQHGAIRKAQPTSVLPFPEPTLGRLYPNRHGSFR